MGIRFANVVLAVAMAMAMAGTAGAAPPWFTRVLVTNDDGIDDPRLQALARAMAAVAEVVVVAPASNCSGSTNYVSAFQSGEITVERRDFGPGIEAWAVAGFPGDCVVLALTGIMADNPPDLLVSGVNSGPNLADAYMASGTLGTARLGAQYGLPSIAFSNLDADDPAMMAAVPAWCVALAASPAVQGLAGGRYLSVNFPDGPVDRVLGARWAAPGEPVFHDAFELFACDGDGHQTWRQRWWFDDGDRQPADGDVALQRAGWITVTIMRIGDFAADGAPEGGLPGWNAR